MSDGYYAREARRVEALVASGAKAWCDTCRKMQPIVDQHDEGHMERRGEVGYMVTDLECGHNRVGDEQVVGPSPGAPYADAAPDLRGRHRTISRSADPWA